MKSYTDINQSKKLAEILPLESADHHYVRKTCDFMGNPVDGKWSVSKYGNPNSKHANYAVQNFTSYEKLPCWSLAALLGLIPYPMLSLQFDKTWYCAGFIDGCIVLVEKCATPIDAAFQLVLKLKKLNYGFID